MVFEFANSICKGNEQEAFVGLHLFFLRIEDPEDPLVSAIRSRPNVESCYSYEAIVLEYIF